MITQRNTLLPLLPRYGWDVVLIEDHLRRWTSDDWFIDELWELESVWAPQGLRAFITFEVDPQYDIHSRKKGKGVWAVTASLSYPRQPNFSEAVLPLSSSWEKRMPEFLSKLADLREKVIENDSMLA